MNADTAGAPYGRAFRILTNPFVILAVIFVVNLATSLGFGMDIDEGIWNYISRLWTEHGIPPYVGAVENKNPSIYFVFALSNRLFGLNLWFPRLLAVIFICASSSLLYLMGRRLLSREAGALSMMLFGLTMSWFLLGGHFPAHAETFMNFFAILSFYLILVAAGRNKKGSYLASLLGAGACMGVAVSFKQIAVFSFAALVVFHLCTREKAAAKSNAVAEIFVIVFGAALTFFATLLPVLRSGVSFDEYLRGAWLILSYTSYSSARIASFNEIWGRSLMKLFYPLVFLFIFQKKKSSALGVPFWGLFFWLVIDFAGVNASGSNLGHQIKLLMPSLALVSGIGLASLFENGLFAESVKLKRVVQLIIIIAVVWMPGEVFRIAKWPLFYDKGDIMQAGMWVKDKTSDADYVYVYGEDAGRILSYAGRMSPTKYFNPFFLDMPGALEETIGDIKAKQPRFVLLPSAALSCLNAYGRVPDWLEKITEHSYHYVDSKSSYDIFERNGF